MAVVGGIGVFLALGRKPETPIVAPLPTAVVSAASAVAERPSDTTTSPTPVLAPADTPTLTPALSDSAAASASAVGKVAAPIIGGNRRVEPKGGPLVPGAPKPAKTVDRGF